uniref:Uncharacterized protein n=1 Tax=Knipowitschia caucasica TaxID=637954 RepID=A0AAV2JLZ9_KNICA
MPRSDARPRARGPGHETPAIRLPPPHQADKAETNNPKARRTGGEAATALNTMGSSNFVYDQETKHKATPAQSHARQRHAQGSAPEAITPRRTASNPKNRRTDPRRSHRHPKRPMAATARRTHGGQHPGQHHPNRTPTIPTAGPRLTRLSGQQAQGGTAAVGSMVPCGQTIVQVGPLWTIAGVW